MFEFQKIVMEHKDNTKSYTIYYIGNMKTGKSAVIRKWGRIGTAGQIKTTAHDRLRGATSELKKLIASKERRGYHQIEAFVDEKDLNEAEVRFGINDVISRADFAITRAVFARPIGGDDGWVAPPQPKAPLPKPEPEPITDSRWGSW